MRFSRVRALRTAAALVSLAGLLSLLPSCGGGSSLLGSSSLFPSTAAVTIELSSSTGIPVVLTPAVAATVTATIYDPSNQGVTWAISPLNFGTLGPQTSTNQPSGFQTISTVTYTAPVDVAATTTLTITATSISNPNISNSLQIKVNPIVVDIINENSSALAVDQTIGPGQQLPLIANATAVLGINKGVTWSISPTSGAGSLMGQTATFANYMAPSSVSSPVTATVTATSIISPVATASLQITVLPCGTGPLPCAAPNVVAIYVNGGPVPTQVDANAAYTSVTICSSGSQTACQTVEGVLVDTGSSGLRILQSEIPLVKLTDFVDPNGNTLENCVSNVDGSYVWGPVARGDFYIGGETSTFSASPVNIQVISSSDSEVVPDSCSNGGPANLNTPQLLGANGILGVGPEPTDCTLAGTNLCDGSKLSTPPNLYYACPSTGCQTTDSPVIIDASHQVTNPVSSLSNTISFSNDNNGVILQLPSATVPESAVLGALTFGIGTETNNGLGSATVFTLDANDYFTTTFSGQTLTSGFIDSGSNALFFPYTLPACTESTQY